MDYKEWFEAREGYNVRQKGQYADQYCTIEEMYQMFKARLMDEMAQPKGGLSQDPIHLLKARINNTIEMINLCGTYGDQAGKEQYKYILNELETKLKANNE